MTPYEQGYMAFLAGTWYSENPNGDENMAASEEWSEGWLKAAEDHED